MFFRRLAAVAVALAALTGFEPPSAIAGTGTSKPVCCRPSHCQAQITTKTCCKMGPVREAPASVPFERPAPQKLALSLDFPSILIVVDDRPLVGSVVPDRPFSTAPPIFALKSSLLI